MKLAYDSAGLLPAIVQDGLTGEVRMLAWMSEASLARTFETGRATFWSRSRAELWEKGATSGNALRVRSVHADCDADALVVLADPAGPSCHTGAPSCFVHPVEPSGVGDPRSPAAPFLVELERSIEARKAAPASASYTRTLLDGGAAKIGEKIREEAAELADAIAGESDERVASEAADVLYHVMVGLASRGVALRDVVAVLAARAGTSGHEEKARRR
jgi:phosphoribosyl-ATP pyrophosphohydrolase/phosphoribosyl-AMP cyclohydrolase